MIPVTGAGASDNGQDQRTGAEAGQTASTAPSEPLGSNERVLAVLEAMGELPADAQTTEDNANGEENREIPGSAGVPAGQDGSGGRGQAAGGAQAQAGGEKGQPQAGDEEEIDPETRQQLPASVIKMLDKRRHQRNTARDETKAERTAREAAERERDQLREQLQSTRQVRLQATPSDPLADVTNENELLDAKGKYEELVEFGTLHPNGAMVVKRGNAFAVIDLDANGQPDRELQEGEEEVRQVTAAGARKMRVDAERILREHLPKRAEYLHERAQNDAAAQQAYPEIFEEGTPEAQVASAFLNNVPGILKWSDGLLWVGRAVRQFMTEQAELAKQAKANGNGAVGKAADRASDAVRPFLTPQPKIAPSTPQPRGGGAAKTPKNVDEAVNRVVETGDDPEAVGDLIGALRNNSQGRRAATV